MRIQHVVFAALVSYWSSTSLAESTAAEERLPLPTTACSYAGNFNQARFLSGIDEPIQTEGHFYFHCEYGVVWATQKPVSDALIVHRNGRGLQVNADQGAQKLTSRQSKFLGQLLTTLMSGDQAALQDLFQISALDTAHRYRLTPRQRKLKRGIQYLVLDLAQLQVGLDQNDNTPSGASLGIEILDRNHQTTRIAATQQQQFEPTEHAASQCQSLANLTDEYCDLLFGL
ncbi:hypothetical protein GCM10008090_25580 [Arenicella chitinivorans]|uniref:Outer membrane lipoprotein carrier protein LolA n=1 Tax=Arenicella chitinivorans TaxID=1329800 RepID=A0A918RXF2_9GAMM|nr:outer membrane lipoprotein carrier protein LolA [Arenicella chitinivorans]GHA14658.1 hypothetical protein GCM10008090_25580 [Arenicella chitinivorans]